MKELDNIEQFLKDNRSAFDTDTPSANVWVGIENQLSDSDVFEKFIQENRAAFDTEIPNLKVWAAIEKQVNPIKEYKIVRMAWWKQAAAAIALLIVGAGMGIFLNEKAEVKALAQSTEQVVPDLTEAENYYNKKVETELTKLVSYNPDPSVMADLKQLDEVQKELKKELENAPTATREEIIHRMIENYQIKLGILERVLNHIEEHQTENKKIQQNESI